MAGCFLIKLLLTPPPRLHEVAQKEELGLFGRQGLERLGLFWGSLYAFCMGFG